MVSITQAFAIDLTGQVCVDQFGGEFYGGVSTQLGFIRGAARSRGGKPIVCLSSTTEDGASRIKPLLEAGDGVGIARSDVHYVITEYGIAYLFGQSIRVEILSRNTSMLRLAARAQGTMTTSRDEDVMQVTVLFPDSARKPPAEPAYDDRAPAQIP